MREAILTVFWFAAGWKAGPAAVAIVFEHDKYSFRDRCEMGLWIGVILGASLVCP